MDSEGYRLQGNEEFKAGNYANAVEQYTKAIELDPSNKTLFSNRSAAYLHLENYTEAMTDAQRCTLIDPSFAKGYFRLGCAYEKLDSNSEALAVYLKALDIAPHDEAIRQKASLLKKKLRSENQGPSVGSRSGRGGGGGGNMSWGGLPAPSSWAIGLSPAEQHEWLIDCYRMRVDDMMHYGMGCVGLYSSDAEAKDVVEDFFVFCKLALKNEIIPNGWDWKAFIETGEDLLAYAFEKSDAKEKYGRENVFAVMTGGRSLRFTAEAVYESSCISSEGKSVKEVKVRKMVDKGLDVLFREGGSFEDVGGVAVWRRLEKQIEKEIEKEKVGGRFY